MSRHSRGHGDLASAANLVDKLEVARSADDRADDAELALRFAGQGVQNGPGCKEGGLRSRGHDGQGALGSSSGSARDRRVANLISGQQSVSVWSVPRLAYSNASAEGIEAFLHGDKVARGHRRKADDR